MIQPLEFIRPGTLQKVLEMLAANDAAVRPLAGGTDIVPGMQQQSRRFAGIRKLIDIAHLPELTGVRETDHSISLGAALTFSQIQQHPLLQEKFPLLVKAVSTIGSLQIRNRATLAGNFVNNAPCADSVPALLVYGAAVRIQSLENDRTLPLAEFLIKPYQTQLEPDELVTEIILPLPDSAFRGDFRKLGRRRGVAISRITLAVVLKIADNSVTELRAASGAVTPIGVRFTELEEWAKGQEISDEFMRNAADRLGRAVLEKTGLRWSTPHKLPVTQQMFYQLLFQLIRK